MKPFTTMLAAITLTAAATAQSGKTLDIYIADTEGGKAALYVSPSGETLPSCTGRRNTPSSNPATACPSPVSSSESLPRAVRH